MGGGTNSQHQQEAPVLDASAEGSSMTEEEVVGSFAPAVPGVSRPHTRLQSGIRKEKVYKDGTVRYSFLTPFGEPWSTSEALADKNWKAAMDAEYGALMHNKTWHFVPPQKGRNVIG